MKLLELLQVGEARIPVTFELTEGGLINGQGEEFNLATTGSSNNAEEDKVFD